MAMIIRRIEPAGASEWELMRRWSFERAQLPEVAEKVANRRLGFGKGTAFTGCGKTLAASEFREGHGFHSLRKKWLRNRVSNERCTGKADKK